MRSAIEIRFGGAQLVLDGSGALFWPQHGMLVVSDLHFEKASFLAQHGSLIAPYDTMDTLQRLQAVVQHYRPRELVLLGDSLHDAQAWQRLDNALRQQLATLVGQVQHCRWIEGNHDVVLRGADAPLLEEQYEQGGIAFRHEYVALQLPQVIGHYHPKSSLVWNRQKVRGRCFVHSDALLVMPAFGSFTGGLEISDPAFQRLFAKPADIQVYLLYKNKLYKRP